MTMDLSSSLQTLAFSWRSIANRIRKSNQISGLYALFVDLTKRVSPDTLPNISERKYLCIAVIFIFL